MRQNAEQIISRVDTRGFCTDEGVTLGDKLKEISELYQKGAIVYKAYQKGHFPPEEEMVRDFQNMVAVYQEYAAPKEPESSVPVTERAWLLTWNPQNWNWNDYAAGLEASRLGEHYETVWSCSNTHVEIGDRVFLVLLGNNGVRGIIAAGTAISKGFETPHWDYAQRARGKKVNSIRVSFDKIQDFRSDAVLKLKDLQQAFPEQTWNPQSSGITIKKECIGPLEKMWRETVGTNAANNGRDLWNSLREMISK